MFRISRCPLTPNPALIQNEKNDNNCQRKAANEGKMVPWNKGKVIGQKLPLSLVQAREIRQLLSDNKNCFHLALFLTAFDSVLRASDLLNLSVSDVFSSHMLRPRETMAIRQQKTGNKVRFALSQQTIDALAAYIQTVGLGSNDNIFSRLPGGKPITTRHYQRLIKQWVAEIGLEPSSYSSHSLRRTKPSILYRETGDVETVRILLGHDSLGSTASYLGVSVEKALRAGQSIQA